MKRFGMLLLLSLAVAGLPAVAGAAGAEEGIRGHYMEFRTVDVYTGPCFAMAEVNLTGHEGVLAWRIERGAWEGTSLKGLSVVAVVRASATLGDPYANPLPAKTVFLVDERADAAQRDALVRFAQAQARRLLDDVVAVESAPIRFEAEHRGRHGFSVLEAGDVLRVSTRTIGEQDHFCANEVVFYQPLAENLDHAMAVVAQNASYQGNHLGTRWEENGRRGSFVGAFSY